MKTKFAILLPLLFLITTTAFDTGCARKGQYNPQTGVYDVEREGDPFIVNAQRVRAVALEVFDGFMKIERMEEARLLQVNPSIHAMAEHVRRNGKSWLADLTNAIDAYPAQQERRREAETHAGTRRRSVRAHVCSELSR